MELDKYQEALEILDRFSYGDNAYTTNLIVNSVKTLQELIDKYERLEKALNNDDFRLEKAQGRTIQ